MEMKKTTVYLPDDLKERVKAIALKEKCSVARLIRDAISAAVASRVAPRPRIPLSRIPLGDPTISERVAEADLQ
jgi:hypothetical protein